MYAARRSIRLLGLLISAGCLAVLAANVDWSAFVASFREADLLPIAVGAGLLVVTCFLFTLRWRLLLALQPRLSVLRVFRFLMSGYFVNLVLPMRAGDALRVVLVRNAYGHGAARAVTSILIERLLDVTAVLALAFVVTLTADVSRAIYGIVQTAGLLVVAATVALVLVTANAAAVSRYLRQSGRFGHSRLASAAAEQISNFGEAARSMYPRDRESATQLVSIIMMTALGWGSYATAMILCLSAFEISEAVPAGLSLTAVTNLGSAVPSLPASLGVYHALGVLALSPWRISFAQSLSIATVSHAMVVGVQLLLGLTAMIATRRDRDSDLSNR
ncbi:MAG TPA: lysylphosphatidylglycerol synthase transmembrane domain-containing protein [Casimicrobiaceae bacterium]|nr:lysylphosphatidylglycerol synthase transmembrane domain-containing protein [Casimicrobiaceae bacterium]